LAPSSTLHIDGFGPPVDREQLPTVLMLLLGDNMHFANTPALLPDVVQWLVGTAGTRQAVLKMASLTYLERVAVCMPESVRSLRVSELNASLVGCLRTVSTEASPPPAGAGKKVKNPALIEVDGNRIRDFFTVLNYSTTRAYSADQVM